jgi:hypothetical protein
MIHSYLFYSACVLVATIFAGLAQKFSHTVKGKKVPNTIYYYLSMCVLIFVMGFRAQTAVDDQNYLAGYNFINSMSIVDYYKYRATEPLFVLLNYFVKYVFNDFQWLLIITSAATIFFFFKAISYENENISLPFAVFIFSLTQYFYYFGILRLGLAASLIAYGYRFVIEHKRKKFIFIVILSTLFHYSALFALIFLLYRRYQSTNIKLSTLWIITITIPVAFYFVRIISPYLSERYHQYFQSEAGISLGFIEQLPLLVLFLLNYKKLKEINHNNEFYFMLFFIRIITEVFTPIIGIGRMIWYVALSSCFLLPASIKVTNSYFGKYMLFSLTILYCIYYSYFAYFGDSFRSVYMLPYRNIFFNIGN